MNLGDETGAEGAESNLLPHTTHDHPSSRTPSVSSYAEAQGDHINEKVQSKYNVHWRPPSIMVGAYALGLGLAVGHHFYYRGLDQSPVEDQSQQEWALRIGTGLAFLTKTFLVIAVGVACVQNFWLAMQMSPVRLSTVDSMFDVRFNPLAFFDVHMWRRGPWVAVLGAVTWLIPLVAVVTPSTLSVQLYTRPVVSDQPMPILNFTGEYWFSFNEGRTAVPSTDVYKIVTATAVRGLVSPPSIPAPNSSYTLEFLGPALKCELGNDTIQQIANDEIPTKSVHTQNVYVSWVPSVNTTADISSVLTTSEEAPSMVDLSSSDFARIYLALPVKFPIIKVWECGLYNASYTAEFRFENGIFSPEIKDLVYLNGVPGTRDMDQASGDPPALADRRPLAYTAIMTAIGELLVGVLQLWPLVPHDTKILSTSLANTLEVQKALAFGENITTENLPSLESTLEQLGHNITLSFFSMSEYLQNTSQAAPVNVTSTYSQNIFVYSQKYLLISYGAAVLVSLVSIILGFVAFSTNRLAFNNSVSTIIRTTRNQTISEMVHPADTSGAEPLPDGLARRRLRWVRSSKGSEGYISGFLVTDGTDTTNPPAAQESSLSERDA